MSIASGKRLQDQQAVRAGRHGGARKQVRTIAAKPQMAPPAAKPRKLRVCAYCRVSTSSAEQETSYEAQVVHYTNYIKANPDWAFAGIFADEGISGTQAKKRPEFNRMIAACERGDIDMVVTKSISRFARNTIDCLNYIRHLKELRIPIIFEKESINTMESAGELLVTILASIAQQESKSISDNVRMGIEFGFQEGRGRLNYTNFLGYTGAGAPGQLVIVPDEAWLVRRIFREYLEGLSPGMIAKRLTGEGAPAPAGGQTWYASTVASILRNEKYCGDLLMQKYFTEDYLTHKVVRNEGQRPQYLVENAHEPIVPKEVFGMVQEERRRRGALKGQPAKLRFGSSEALSGRVVCGKCGRTLKRYRKPDARLDDWRCRPRARNKKTNEREQPGARCDCRIAPDAEMRTAVLTAFNALPSWRDEIVALSGWPTWQHDDSESSCGDRLEGHEGRSIVEYIQMRTLLELVDEMQSRAAHTAESQANTLVTSPCLVAPTSGLCTEPVTAAAPQTTACAPYALASRPAACYDAEDFFQRTRYEIPRGVLDEYGAVARFCNNFVTRFLKCVTVMDDGYVVSFKAGICAQIIRGMVVEFTCESKCAR